MNINSSGILYIVATPIGNLQDITFRAIDVLKNADVILVEDTRHSQSLLQHFGIKKTLLALHEHNERETVISLLKRLGAGETFALISDAGTPLISDPGYFIVHEALKAGLKVVPVPGACAAIAALSVSGLPTDKFIFEGFLSAKTGLRLQRLEKLKREQRTIIFYESPHRIVDMLIDLQTVFGAERVVTVARELTKLFETVKSDSISNIIKWMNQDSNQTRGEFVVVVEGIKEQAEEKLLEMDRILKILLNDLPLKQAVELTSKITGEKKNNVYKLALELK